MQKGKYFLLFFLMAFIAVNSKAQVVADDKVIADGKLRWEDFSGPVDPNSKFSAMTHWQVNYKYNVLSVRADTVIIDLQVSMFLKENSWVLPNHKTDYLLQHEQGHFNLGILCASRFKKVMMSTTLLKSDYANKINLTFKAVLADINQLNLLYDEETNHSRNTIQQKKWNDKIDSMLMNP